DTEEHPGLVTVHDDSGDEAAEGRHVPDRQVQGAAQDDEGLPDGDEAEQAGAGEDVEDRATAEQVVTAHGEEHAGDDEQDQQGDVDERDRAQRGAPGGRGAGGAARCGSDLRGGGHHALSSNASWRVARAMTASSSQPPGSSPLISPSWSTMIRSAIDRKSTRLNSSHVKISYSVFC